MDRDAICIASLFILGSTTLQITRIQTNKFNTMQCFKCQNKWKDTTDTITGFCPSCGTNLLQSLTKDSKKIKPEYKLQYVIQSFGFDILQEKCIISGIINDLFSPNIKLKKIILASIKLKIPDKLKEADCSIAIGSGSDAARQVSQLILLGSDFSVLPSVVSEGRRVINNITRTASLFLVKTIYTFMLTITTILLRIKYPFIPIQISLIGLFVEGIPAFFLAFEPNNERVTKNFLKTVLSNALPSSLIIIADILLIHYAVTPMLHLGALEATTLDVYVMGFVWLMQLFHVCRPFTKIHFILWGSMVACFYTGAILFRGLLSIGALSLPSLFVFALFAGLCYPIQLMISAILTNLTKSL